MFRELYARRNKYVIFGILSLLTPFPGIAFGCFIQAKAVDCDIRREIMKMENCKEMCCKKEQN